MALIFPVDTVQTADGGELKITFYAHASLGFEFAGKHIYLDPVTASADYSKEPKADLILITHAHSDHLDAEAIKALSKPGTQVIGNAVAVNELGYGDAIRNGEGRIAPYLAVEAVPAYNTTPERQGFHTPDGRDNGYILTFGGTRIYVSSDTEDTPELLALKDIDIAFLPVNQPYTMTEEQAARAVKALRPKIFYPIHTGQTDHKTDLDKLVRLLADSAVDVRIRPME
jgi:L-ascorbate metabolism protein UlaG (beta-lactamase superfamily)